MGSWSPLGFPGFEVTAHVEGCDRWTGGRGLAYLHTDGLSDRGTEAINMLTDRGSRCW